MGGYAFDVSKNEKPRIWPRQVDRLTLSSRAVQASLNSQDKELGAVIPFLSEEQIWDKRKANGLAKAIVCMQALWFCTQRVVRLAQGMPISLLELNTFAYALCALLVYLHWWNKPLDVQEPTLIDINKWDAVRYVCAVGWSGPQGTLPHLRRVYPPEQQLWKRILVRPIRAVRATIQWHLDDGTLTSPTPTGQSTLKHRIRAGIHHSTSPSSSQSQPALFQGLTPGGLKSRVWVSSDPAVFSLRGGERIPSTSLFVSNDWESIEVDEIFLERLRVVERLQTSDSRAAYETAFSHILDTTDKDHCMLKQRELNFTDSLMRQTPHVSPVGKNLAATSGIVFSGVLYGGLHMLAWGSTSFNTYFEQIAWRISCCAVASGGIFTLLGIWGLEIASKMQRPKRRLDILKAVIYICAPIYLAFFLLYLVSRVFLLVEVFRSLAFLDQRVYLTPEVRLPLPIQLGILMNLVDANDCNESTANDRACSGLHTFPTSRETDLLDSTNDSAIPILGPPWPSWLKREEPVLMCKLPSTLRIASVRSRESDSS